MVSVTLLTNVAQTNKISTQIHDRIDKISMIIQDSKIRAIKTGSQKTQLYKKNVTIAIKVVTNTKIVENEFLTKVEKTTKIIPKIKITIANLNLSKSTFLRTAIKNT